MIALDVPVTSTINVEGKASKRKFRFSKVALSYDGIRRVYALDWLLGAS